MHKETLGQNNPEANSSHKNNKSKLQENGERYQELAESISDVFFAMDKNLRYTYWNKASEKLTGIPSEKVIGKTLIEIFPDNEGREQMKNKCLKVIKGKQMENWTVKYPGNQLLIHEISAYPTKEGVSVFARDITERKQAEERLLKNEEQYRTLIENASDGIFIIDQQSKIIEANKTGYKNIGYTKEEILSLSLMNIINMNANEVSQLFNKLSTGKAYIYEKMAIHKNGLQFPIEINARLLKDGRMMGIVRDISERKIAEEKLKMYKTIIESATDAISVKDINGNYILVNQTFAKRYNLTPEEIIGKTAFNLYPNDNAKNIDEELNEIIKTDQPMEVKQHFLLTSGEIFTQNILSPLKNESGKVIGIFNISRDITEQKKLENEIYYNSYHDKLTELYNRRYLEEELDRLQNSRHYPVSIFSLDLDGLKIINDTFGHSFGDKYIHKAAEILNNTFPRTEDFKCRMGGDEFVIIISEADQTTIQQLTEKLRLNLQNAQIQASIGVATADSWDKSLRKILKEADEKMYADKKVRKATLNPTIVTD